MNTYGPLFDDMATEGNPEPAEWRRITGQQLKEKGLAQVSEHNKPWMRDALSVSEAFAALHEGDFTGEDLRLHCRSLFGNPLHPNAWGALINTLIKRKIIVPTGEHRKMRDTRSHARSTPVYKAL